MRKEVDGFNFITIRDKDFLCVESKRLDECLVYAQQKDIRNLKLDWYSGYNLDHLDFLKGTDFEKLSISLERIKDVEALNHMPSLKGLYFGGAALPQVVDLSNRRLEELAFEWSAKLVGLNTLGSLRYLSIAGLKQKDKNLVELGNFPELKEIRIVNGNLNSLEGIQAYDKLRAITVAYARSLTELGKQNWDFKALESLGISNCKKLSPDSFSRLPSLKNFEFSDCGPVPTLEWIAKVMPKLEDLNFWGTKPEDGDLSFVMELKNLKNIHFKDEKHYNAKCKDLKESVKNNKDLSAVITGAPAIKIEKDETLPTSRWKKQGFSDEQVKKVDDILNKFIKDIGEAKSEDQKIKAFEVAVKALDKMQLNNDYFLDTLCREDLVNFFNEKAHEHGLDQFDDITWEWREEW